MIVIKEYELIILNSEWAREMVLYFTYILECEMTHDDGRQESYHGHDRIDASENYT